MGVYNFGSRKVLVKAERNSVQVKVGGGFLSIDEFLDQYTPVELERLGRKDPLRRSNDKAASGQRTLGGDRTTSSISPGK